ncbi:MAG: hypothetical protein JXR96_11105 [Deltaproteobacteria bacterium]|nr:hypothetical protein [Deltaproteobacteria bacterium]
MAALACCGCQPARLGHVPFRSAGRCAGSQVVSHPRFVQISVGDTAGCGIDLDGRVLCWGDNQFGLLGQDVSRCDQPMDTGIAGAVQLAVGHSHACAVFRDGKVRCWGLDVYGQLGIEPALSIRGLSEVRGLTGAEEVAVGSSHSCARLADGRARCWGCNYQGQIGDGSTCRYRDRATPVEGLSDAIQIAAGGESSCALHTDGRVSCWGWNLWGQVGDGSEEEERDRTTRVAGIEHAGEIALGAGHACARDLAGESLHCWGWNFYGQLGDGTEQDRSRPVRVQGLTGIRSMALGVRHSCALRFDGRVECWGANDAGQAGGAARRSILRPRLVDGPRDIRELSLSAKRSCARSADAELFCWGEP